MTTPTSIAEIAHRADISEDFGTWVPDARLIVDEYSDGSGQTLGSASLHRLLGNVTLDAATSLARVTPVSLAGKYLRICALVGTAVIPVWYGKITEQAIADPADESGATWGTQTYSAVHVCIELAQVAIDRAWVQRTDGATTSNAVRDLGRMPPFNDQRFAWRGDMTVSATMATGGSASDKRAFALVPDTTGNAGLSEAWSYQSAIEQMLDWFGKGQVRPSYATVAGPIWAISDDTGGALASLRPTAEEPPATVLDLINQVANPRRGLTWYPEVSGQIVTIHVIAARPGITLPPSSGTGTGLTLASPPVVTLDCSNHEWSGISVGEDHSAVVDVITVQGSRPWMAMTVVFDAPAKNGSADASASLAAGWTDDERAQYDDTGSSDATVGVFRQFVIRSPWNGQAFTWPTDAGVTAGAGLRNLLTWSAWGTTDGSREHNADYAWQPQALEFTTELPVDLKYSTSTAKLAVDSSATTNAKPLALVYDVASTSWVSLTSSDPAATCYSLTIDATAPGVSLGSPGESPAFAAWLGQDTRALLAVTVGILESAPLTVACARTDARPVRRPRSLTVRIPALEQRGVLAGTILGLDKDGKPVVQDSTLLVRDDLPRARQILAMLAAAYFHPRVTASATHAGVDVDVDAAALLTARRPGTYLTALTIGAQTLAVGSPITRRTVNARPGQQSTTYETTPCDLDVSAIA